MAHTVTLELKLTVSRKGMAEVTTELLEHEVGRMVSAIQKTFAVDSVDYNFSATRTDD